VRDGLFPTDKFVNGFDRHRRLALVRHAIFGEDSFRFAAMLGAS
jgi:hypothetical protein